MATVRYTVVDGEIIAEKRASVRRQYVPDTIGSTVALLDSSQTSTDTFSYWPYGEEQSRTGTTDTPFRFVGTSGYYKDNLTRTYVRARHLNTGLGRWMTEEPVGFGDSHALLYRSTGGSQLSLIQMVLANRYLYVDGSPTQWVDTNGLQSQKPRPQQQKPQLPQKPPPPPPQKPKCPPPKDCKAIKDDCRFWAGVRTAACFTAATLGGTACYAGCAAIPDPTGLIKFGCIRTCMGIVARAFAGCSAYGAAQALACDLLYSACKAEGGKP